MRKGEGMTDEDFKTAMLSFRELAIAEFDGLGRRLAAIEHALVTFGRKFDVEDRRDDVVNRRCDALVQRIERLERAVLGPA
jgi:hypothetical protein